MGPLPESGYMTSRLRLRFPDDSWYTVGHLVLDRAVIIYINNARMLDVGVVGEVPDAVLPASSRISFAAKPEDGMIEIIVQSSAFVRPTIRTDTIGWYVGGDYLQDTFRRVDQIQNIIMGSFLLLSVLGLLLHFNIRSKIRSSRINLLFALFSFTWFLSTGVIGANPLGDLFPWVGWEAQTRIGFFIIHMTVGLMVAIIHALFPGLLHKYFRVGIYGVSAVFAAAAALVDVSVLSAVVGAGGPAPFIFLAGIAYVIVRFATKLRTINRAQYIFLCGIALFLYITIRDILWHMGDILLPPYGGAGLMVFHEFMIMTAAVAAFLLTLCAALAVFLTVNDEIEEAYRVALEAAVKEQTLTADNLALDRLSRLKSNFLADISHEMKTPLTVMGGFADLTRWQIGAGTTSESTLENLTTIADEAGRLAELVDRLLDVSAAKESAAKGVQVFVPDIISRAAALCRPILAASGNSLEVEIEKNCPPVHANPDVILQVLFNLLGNANRHTKEGLVKLTARPFADEGMVHFRVQDNGAGIPVKLLADVFQRGVSGDGGTGLGLAICKEAVEASGGAIQIESQAGSGTTIFFTLPISQEEGV